MAHQPPNSSIPRRSGPGYLFGTPIGDLGWFTSLLMSVASGFIAFFLATFCSIITILLLNSFAHKEVDYTISYRRIGLPIGLVVLVLVLGYLGTLWGRRQLRRS